MTRTILVTGGAGYIGSHAVIELRAAGYDVVVYDNLCNSSPEVLNRLSLITGRKVPFVQGDIRDAAALRAVLAAAWQFWVRPPRVGGVSKVGDWVRIRIELTDSRDRQSGASRP